MEVEWLIIADAAQVVGGKLLGGGYDRVTLPKGPPAGHSMAVAVSFRVPWNETNVKHDFELKILDGDGRGYSAVTASSKSAALLEYSPDRTSDAAGDEHWVAS